VHARRSPPPGCPDPRIASEGLGQGRKRSPTRIVGGRLEPSMNTGLPEPCQTDVRSGEATQASSTHRACAASSGPSIPRRRDEGHEEMVADKTTVAEGFSLR